MNLFVKIQKCVPGNFMLDKNGSFCYSDTIFNPKVVSSAFAVNGI